jgi:hypothetical protein
MIIRRFHVFLSQWILTKEAIKMVTTIRQLSGAVGRINPRHIRVLLVILSMVMFVIGAGAPGDHGGWGG